MPKSYYWLLLAALAWAVTFLLVPREKIKRLLSIGFWGGLVLTIIIQVVSVYWLGLYKFNFMQFPILGFPLFLPFIWFAETIIFMNFFPESTGKRAVYIIAFSAGVTLINWFLLSYGLQTLIRWNLFYTFLLALVTHTMIPYVYLAYKDRTKIRS